MIVIFSLYKLLFGSFFSFTHPPIEFSGVIADKRSSEPLSNVYVYIFRGEEETLSSSNGRFRVLSWEKLPVTIYFEKKGYNRVSQTFTREQHDKKIYMEAN